MYEPDYKRMSKIYIQLVEADVKDRLDFMTICHLSTYGFSNLGHGLFTELTADIRNGSTIDDVISAGIVYWLDNVKLDMTIDEKHEAVVEGMLYTDTGIRRSVRQMYEDLFNNTEEVE